MRHSALLWLLVLLTTAAPILHAQDFPTDYFDPPLHRATSLSASFAEIRPNHFHSGLDLRIGGKIGEPVYAPADGYVSRIAVSPWGGGKVLYLTHPNGYRTAFMHLNDFCGAIGAWVHDYQYAHHVYAFDTAPTETADTMWVKKGQLVAHAGNTGGSGGPHLHYDIRYAHNDQPINPLYFGLPLNDVVPPVIRGIRLYAADAVSTVGKGSMLSLLSTTHTRKGSQSRWLDTVDVSGRFYTGIYTTDVSEPGTQGKNGVESIELYLDGHKVYSYGVRTFLFEETRVVNALIDYAEYRRSREYYLLSRVLRGVRTPCVWAEGGGIFVFDEPGTHQLEYVVKDYKGNTARRRFAVRYRPTATGVVRSPETDTLSAFESIAYYKKKRLVRTGFEVDMAEYTVYDNDLLTYTSGQHPKMLTVRIAKPEVPPELQQKLVVVCIDGKDIRYCGARHEDDYLAGRSGTWGTFAITLDTTPPTLQPVGLAAKGQCATGNVQVKIGDDLSGIGSYHCYVNEQWVLSEYDGKTRTLTTDARAFLHKGRNEVRYIITDEVGNRTERTLILQH